MYLTHTSHFSYTLLTANVCSNTYVCLYIYRYMCSLAFPIFYVYSYIMDVIFDTGTSGERFLKTIALHCELFTACHHCALLSGDTNFGLRFMPAGLENKGSRFGTVKQAPTTQRPEIKRRQLIIALHSGSQGTISVTANKQQTL